MTKNRTARQNAIREIVRDQDIRTQRRLVAELRSRGLGCTQATASRDIGEMGLRKLPEGVYVLAEDLQLQRMVSELVVAVLRTDNLLVVKTQVGSAASIAVAIDAADLSVVLGTIAGRDTVLIIARTAGDGAHLEAYLSKLCRRT